MLKGRKKARLYLPPNFQEKVLMNEIKLDKGEKSISTIRELLILYSIGTEYYDSINSDMLVQHYMKKSNQIVSNPEYMALIDEHNYSLRTQGYITENDDSIRKRIYEDDSKTNGINTKRPSKIKDKEGVRPPRQTNVSIKEKEFDLSKETNSINDNDSNVNNDNHNNNPFFKRLKTKTTYMSHRNIKLQENEIINSQTKQEIDSIEQKTHKIEEQLSKDIDQQQANFKRLKQLKRTKTKTVKQQIQTPRGSSNPNRRGSKYDVVVESLVLSQGKSEKDVLLDILELSERQMKINQEMMQNEIDEFISQSIKEMNDAIDEIRISYFEDLKEVDENVFPDLVIELKNDMETEIEILKEKYEELRMKQSEKIRNKYMKKVNN